MISVCGSIYCADTLFYIRVRGVWSLQSRDPSKEVRSTRFLGAPRRDGRSFEHCFPFFFPLTSVSECIYCNLKVLQNFLVQNQFLTDFLCYIHFDGIARRRIIEERYSKLLVSTFLWNWPNRDVYTEFSLEDPYPSDSVPVTIFNLPSPNFHFAVVSFHLERKINFAVGLKFH